MAKSLPPWVLVLGLLLVTAVRGFQLPKFEDDISVEAHEDHIVPRRHSGELVAVAAAGLSESPAPPSFGLFVRVTEADLPYFGSFLKHYALLGVNKFYLMNQRFEEDHAELVAYVKNITLPTPTAIEFLSLDDIMHDDPVRTPGLVAAIGEDYIINVDADEYWVLPENVTDLAALVQEHPADIYYMRWVMVVSDDLESELSSPYSANVGFPGKWMARRSIIPQPNVPFRMFGHHVVPTKTGAELLTLGDYKYGMNWTVGEKYHMSIQIFGKPLPAYDSFSPGYMAHFWCRSFYDVILKTQRFNKGETCRSLSSYVKNLTEVPERLRTLAFLSLNTRDPMTVDAGRELMQVDTALEQKLVLEAACEGSREADVESIKSFHTSYLQYKEHLGGIMATGAYPEHWPETALTFASNIGLTVTDWLYSLD